MNKRLKRKQQIIDAAAKVFAEKGYHGATLDDIAAEIKFTKASLYYYVKSKQHVLKEICEILEHDGKVFFQALAESDLNPAEKLRALVTRQIGSCCANKELSTVYLEVSDALDPRSRAKLKKQLKNGEKALQDILSEGNEKGYFAISDVPLAATLIFSACNRIPRWYRDGGRLTPERITEEFINMFEHGFLKHPPVKEEKHRKEFNRIIAFSKKTHIKGRFPIKDTIKPSAKKRK